MTRSSIPTVYIECPILEDYTNDFAVTPCGHAFDTSQILEWININESEESPALCPICRGDVSIETLTYGLDNKPSRIGWKEVFPVQETAKQLFHFLRRSVRTPGIYLINLVEDYTTHRENAYAVIFLSLIPRAIGAGFKASQLAIEGVNSVPLASYRSLSEEATGAIVSTASVYVSEHYRREIISDPNLNAVVRKVYKFILAASRMAIVFGNPIMAVSNFSERNNLRHIGATLVLGGTVATQAAVVVYSTKKDWQNRTSTEDFVNKITQKILYLGCLFLVIYNFAISIFHE